MLNIRSIIIYTSRSNGVNLPAGAVFQESAKTNHVREADSESLKLINSPEVNLLIFLILIILSLFLYQPK
jgi:hypothetical protein